MAATMASTLARSRPSEKFGTHSIRRFMLSLGTGLGQFLYEDMSSERRNRCGLANL
jgi:hypothetical protein